MKRSPFSFDTIDFFVKILYNILIKHLDVLMKAVITVTGRDSMGIIVKVSNVCAEDKINIVDISQSVLSEYFAMIMVVDIEKATIPFNELIMLMVALTSSGTLRLNSI